MSQRMALDHPKRSLMFYVVNRESSDDLRGRMSDFVETLAGSRDWVSGPPEILKEEAGIGGELLIYSALGPHGLPRDVDLMQLQEVTAIMEAVQRFSRDAELTLTMELDGEIIFEVRNGRMASEPDEDDRDDDDGDDF